MNTVTEKQKDTIIKTLAVIGFIAAIVLTVVLAVGIVRLIPSAFSSMASIAESVYHYSPNEQLSVAVSNSVVNSGDSLHVSWTMMQQPGTYEFSYACTSGVVVDVHTAVGTTHTIGCESALAVGNTTALDLTVRSMQTQFVDVPFTVTFTPENPHVKPIVAHNKVTIVNAAVTPTNGAATSTTPANNGVTTVATTSVTTTSPATTTPSKPATRTIQQPIYTMPVSDPNGTVDLQVTYVGIGVIENQHFIPTGQLVAGQPGAYQFAVKNIGTKTAATWSYLGHLPGGLTYNGGQQVPLKPNETAFITLGFPGLSHSGQATFGAEVALPDDVNLSNNGFSHTAIVQ